MRQAGRQRGGSCNQHAVRKQAYGEDSGAKTRGTDLQGALLHHALRGKASATAIANRRRRTTMSKNLQEYYSRGRA